MAKTQPTLRDYIACYALYIGLIIPGTILVLLIWRNAILAMLGAFMRGSDANQLIYLASMVFLGLGGFILVIAAGPYLSNGLPRQQLMRRFLRLAVPLLIAAVLALIVLTVI